MCSVEDAEPWDVVTTISRKARKEHRCLECHRTIRQGEKYLLTEGLCDGRWSSYKVCQHCEHAAGWLMVVCNGWVYGQVLEELIEHFRDGWSSLPFGRMILDMRSGWHEGMDPVPDGAELGRAAMARYS